MILGIANLAFNIHKEYFRKGKLQIEVENANVKCATAGTYDLQIDIVFSVIIKDLYIREMSLIAPCGTFGSWAEETDVNLNKLIPQINQDLLLLPHESFVKEVKELFEKKVAVRNLKLDKDSYSSYSILDELVTGRYPDGYESFPVKGWKLRVVHSYGESNVEFDFTVNPDSGLGYFTRRD